MFFVLLFIIFVLGIPLLRLYYVNKYNNLDNGYLGNNDRISIENARRQIYKGKLGNIKEYTISGPNTGIYPNWDTNVSDLGKICDTIKDGLCYAYHNNNDNATWCIRVSDDFIERYRLRLFEVGVVGHDDNDHDNGSNFMNNNLANKIPWGNNWYEFSVSSTCMMAYYLLLPNTKNKNFVAKTILLLISDPVTSLGIKRTGINALYLVGPFILAHYTLGTLTNEIFNSNAYRYILEYMKFEYVRKQGVSGLHLDNTFVFHDEVILFSYLSTLDSSLTNYYYSLDTWVKSPISVWNKCKEFIAHPTIGYSSMSIYGRNKNLKFITYKNSPFGIKVLPFGKYLRYFTDTYQFSAKGHTSWFAFYESDKTNYVQALYWTHYRNVHTKNSKEELKFPDPGFICDSKVNELIELKPTSEFVKAFKTKNAQSFVFKFKNFGILWQAYSIDEYGEFTVYELIVVNSSTNIIEISLLIVNRSTKDLVYYSVDGKCSIEEYRNKLTPLTITANSMKPYLTVFNLNEKYVETQEKSINVLLPILITDDILIESVGDTFVVLSYKKEPLILSPVSLESETEYITVEMNGKQVHFEFDKIENQYLKK